jgi:hypothetical protein
MFLQHFPLDNYRLILATFWESAGLQLPLTHSPLKPTLLVTIVHGCFPDYRIVNTCKIYYYARKSIIIIVLRLHTNRNIINNSHK